ncbi:cyclophilin-like fold protein [Mycetocola zhadangensis]|uniref:cyclophilin-like fold protein n=1 Tax=Mycetocola zhadangensis TaxID=1164595 RepID=UPI003A4DC9DC
MPGETAITPTAGDVVITATLNDTQVAQDFAATLPTTLPWFRNAGIEYITELPTPLTETGPFYTDVQPGDLVYYNPTASITIIYERTTSVPTLTYMGEITSDLSQFENLPDDVDMLVELG